MKCEECQEKITQLDMFNPEYNQVVGCKKLSKKKWNAGLKGTSQSNCPLKKSKVL